MRILIGVISAAVVSILAGCGQTGALQLPSDPNYDKRAQYLIYKNSDRPSQDQAEPKADAVPTQD
ncbi:MULTISPECIES: lipoprotein [unclassified Acinetobacter]|uniref:LPS translocon maturation chaperone LptM n=1 Tax=unclassified Acinetobacter TaxID=196816 RepID=UPI00044DC15F|nr:MULTISPECIES: lipoprotein [unclassified Acinetobacter]EZQ10261.1 hypothetical protein CL42_08335 [Acinetobacter sp. Ver3]